MLISNGNPIQFLVHDGTTHDVKVAPALVDKIDLTDTDAMFLALIRDMTRKL